MIGLDIGTKSVKMCEVKRKEKRLVISSAVIAANPAGGETAREDALVSGRIKTILKNTAFSTRSAAASLGSVQIVARNFTFPAMPLSELKGAVQLEAGQAISSNLRSLYTDFQVLSTVDGDNTDVLFVGVPMPLVDRNLQIIRNAGLSLEIMDIDNLALVNSFLAFEPEPVNESIVLVNIGHTNSNLAVLENQQLRFIRNVTFGGRNITSEIAQRLGVTEDMAEEIKKRPEFWDETGLNIRNILRKSMADLIEAIYRSIEFCMSRKKIVNVDRILITGGSARLRDIDHFITEALGILHE